MGTTATANFPGLTLEAAFGTPMTTAATSWTDVTTGLRGGSIRRGRTREDQPFGAGEMRLIMDNRSRQWDPEYSAGAHFGDLVPMLQMRLKATYSSIIYPVFYGYVESFNQNYPGQDADSVCEIVVVDGFSVLQNALLPDSVWDYQTGLFVDDTATYPGSFWYPLGEKYGTVMGDKGPNNLHGTYGAQIVSNQPGLVPYAGTGQALKFDGIDDRGDSPANAMPTYPYTIGFWVKMPDEFDGSSILTMISCYDATTSNSAASLAVYIDQTTLAAPYLVVYNARMGAVDFLSPRYSDAQMQAGRTYFVCFTYDSADPNLYIDGVLQSNVNSGFTTTTVFSPNVFRVGGETVAGWSCWPSVIDDVAVLGGALAAADVLTWYQSGSAPWDGDTSGDRVTNVLDSISWPATLRDIDAGESVLGSATLTGAALQYLQLVEKTEQGRFFMSADGKATLIGRGNLITDAASGLSNATFGDNAGEMKYHTISVEPGNAQQIINEATISRQGGIDQKYRDDTSASSYGVRTRNESGLLMGTDGEAYDLGHSIVRRYKDPGFRVTELGVEPRRDAANLFPLVLGFDLAWRITVNRRPQAVGSVISKDVHIEGIQHSFDAGAMSWSTTWSTAPIDPNEDLVLIVGSATQGIVGTNLVGY